jgi:hypothetical protein
MMKDEAPIEYSLIVQYAKYYKVKVSMEIVENIIYASGNVVFGSYRFQKALMDFSNGKPDDRRIDILTRIKSELKHKLDRINGQCKRRKRA